MRSIVYRQFAVATRAGEDRAAGGDEHLSVQTSVAVPIVSVPTLRAVHQPVRPFQIETRKIINRRW